MTINERIFSIMKAKKITQGDLANALNITQSSITNWKTRGTTPPMEYLPTICEVLGVSWEYLITGEERLQKEPLPKLTDEESIILELFRKTAPTDKAEIKEYIEFKIQKRKAQP